MESYVTALILKLMVEVAGLYKIIGTRNVVFIGITCGFTSTGSINFFLKSIKNIQKYLKICEFAI